MLIPKENAIVFFGKEHPCSNWFEAPFLHKGVGYRTNEHFMMAKKACLFNDHFILERILRSKTPKRAKELGREVRDFDEDIWNNWKKHIVGHGKIQQALQNPIVLQFLVANKDKVFIEASPYDKVWGIGLGELHPGCYDTDQWLGLNELGDVLSKVAKILYSLTTRSN